MFKTFTLFYLMHTYSAVYVKHIRAYEICRTEMEKSKLYDDCQTFSLLKAS